MPVRTVRISSVSGDVIPEGTGARVRVIWADEDRVDFRSDLTDAEAQQLIQQYGAEEVEARPDRRRRR